MLRKKSKKPNKKAEIYDIDLMEELEYYQKPKPKKGVDQRVIIGVVRVLLGIIGVLLSPVFCGKKYCCQWNKALYDNRSL